MLSQKVKEVVLAVRRQGRTMDLRVRDVMVDNLRMVYHITVASERLLIEGAKESSNELLSDYFLDHLAEERHHSAWLAEDLLSAGVVITNDAPHPLAVAIAGAAYYYIKHVHPACLLGYMAALECYSSDMLVISELEEIHGPLLMRTARHHAEHDPQHSEYLLNAIDLVGHPGILMAAQQTAARIAAY